MAVTRLGGQSPRRIGYPARLGTVDIRFQRLQQQQQQDAGGVEEPARPTSAGFVPLRRWSPADKLRPPSRTTEKDSCRHVAAQFRREALASGIKQARAVDPPLQPPRAPDLPERPHSVAHSTPGVARPRSPFSEASHRLVARPRTADALEMAGPLSRRPRLGGWPAQSAEEVATVLTEKFAAETAQLQHAGFHRANGPSSLWVSRSADDLRPWSPSLSAMLDRAHSRPEREASTDPSHEQQPKAIQKGRRRQTGFFAFIAEQRPLLLNKLPEASSADFAAMLTELWKDLSPQERRTYEDSGDTRATQAHLDRHCNRREDSTGVTPGSRTGAVRGRRQLGKVSPSPGRQSLSPERHRQAVEMPQRMHLASRAGLGASLMSDTEPVLLQIEEKLMTLNAKGAPLHLGHFSSAPARAHRAQMQHHKGLQRMRLKSGKDKTAAAAATVLALKPAGPSTPEHHSATPDDSGARGWAESHSHVRDCKLARSRKFFYPVQVASPSLFNS